MTSETRESAASVLGLVGVWIVVALFAFLNRNYELDDALIYYRYVRNVLQGHGLVYNVGEYFNALTSPLHAYLSIVICGLLGSIRYPMIVQSALFTAATTAVLYVLYRRHERLWPFVLLGTALIAGWRYFHSLYGMETPLLLFLIGACLFLYERRRTFWLGIACALLILTRGEGVLLVLVMAVFHLVRRRPLPRLRDFVVPALLLGGHSLFNKLYYGSFLPHTLMAKIHQGSSGLWGERLNFLRVDYQLHWYFGGSRILLGVFLVLAVLGMLRLGRKELNLIVLTFLSALTLFYLLLNVPNYHWYYAPLYAFGCIYVGLGAAALFSFAERLPSRLLALAGRAAAAALGAGLLVWSSYAAYGWPVSASPRQKQYMILGNWLKQNTSPDATVAMVEVGIIGYHSERRIVDILGLVSPKNAESLGGRRFAEWLENYEPDYILVHDPAWLQERGAAEYLKRGTYRFHNAFNFRGYALLSRTGG